MIRKGHSSPADTVGGSVGRQDILFTFGAGYLKSSQFRRAVLTDVDGILVELVDRPGKLGVSARNENEILLVRGLTDAFEKLKELGYLIVGHTNQPDVGNGQITREFLEFKHATIIAQYPQIEHIFVCPHTDADHCDCRKPKPGLLIQAAEAFNLRLDDCWVVGDSLRDIGAGNLVHARTILVQNKYNSSLAALNPATHTAMSAKSAFELIVALGGRQAQT